MGTIKFISRITNLGPVFTKLDSKMFSNVMFITLLLFKLKMLNL